MNESYHPGPFLDVFYLYGGPRHALQTLACQPPGVLLKLQEFPILSSHTPTIAIATTFCSCRHICALASGFLLNPEELGESFYDYMAKRANPSSFQSTAHLQRASRRSLRLKATHCNSCLQSTDQTMCMVPQTNGAKSFQPLV